MEQLNVDCLIHIFKFSSFQDKMSIMRVCKKFYYASLYIFRNDMIDYKTTNTKWLKKYKPKIRLEKISKKILTTTSMLNHISMLDLRHQNLKVFPTSIFKLTRLEYLNLDRTNIRSIPMRICELTNLKELDLYHNKINDLIPCCQLSTLIHLDVSLNRLVNIPDEIENLSNLKRLSLEYNRIVNVSCKIGNLNSNLKYLNLSSNGLKSIPRNLSRLHLSELNLELNELSCICYCIPDTLQSLDIWDNQLKHDCQLPNMVGLKYFTLDKNNNGMCINYQKNDCDIQFLI